MLNKYKIQVKILVAFSLQLMEEFIIAPLIKIIFVDQDDYLVQLKSTCCECVVFFHGKRRKKSVVHGMGAVIREVVTTSGGGKREVNAEKP